MIEPHSHSACGDAESDPWSVCVAGHFTDSSSIWCSYYSFLWSCGSISVVLLQNKKLFCADYCFQTLFFCTQFCCKGLMVRTWTVNKSWDFWTYEIMKCHFHRHLSGLGDKRKCLLSFGGKTSGKTRVENEAWSTVESRETFHIFMFWGVYKQ